MVYKFITTPRSIRNVVIYYKSSDESMHTLHMEKLKGKVTVEGTTNGAKEMRNTRIEINPYLHDINDYIMWSNVNGRFYAASMFSQMIPCYLKLNKNRHYVMTIREIFDDIRCTYISEISIASMIYSSTEEIEKAISKAARSAEVTIGSDYLKMETSNVGVKFTVDPTVETFARDKSVAESIGTYLAKVGDILQDKSSCARKVVICCDKCFKEFCKLTLSYDIIVTRIPDKSCCDGANMINIDAEIYGTIKRLNDIGYHTRYCCASHTWENEIYINFDENDRQIFNDIFRHHRIDGFEIEDLDLPRPTIRSNDEYYDNLKKELGFDKARETMIKRLEDELVKCMEEYKNVKLNPVSD